MASKKRKADQESDLTDAEFQPKPEDGAVEQQQVYEEEAEEPEEEEDIAKLLEPLSKDQLISLLRTAASSDPHTLSEIHRLADLDPSHRKIFVHGLGWETTVDGLRSAFSPFGDIEDCRIVTDRSTGKSKGYGFLLFRHRRSARSALRQPAKLIDSRMTSCQLAATGPPSSAPPNPNPNLNSNPSPNFDNLSRKIYVGNVHSDIDGGRLLAFFSKFGEIEEGPIGFDRQSGKPKGFALFIYRTAEGARKALEESTRNFEGHLLYCQKATDSNKSRAVVAQAANSVAAPNVPGGTGGYNGHGYGGPQPDMGMAQQAAMMGQQGFLGVGGPQLFGQGMQPNAAALAMLAAAGQNPAAFGISPAMFASLNPAFAAAMSAAGAPVVPNSAVPQTAPVQGYGMGNTGYQNVGFQGQPQVAHQGGGGGAYQGGGGGGAYQGGGGGGPYQGGPMVQGQMQRPPMGPMGGYGPH